MNFFDRNSIDHPEILKEDFDWKNILDDPSKGWDRFSLVYGAKWGIIVEMKIGNITPEEVLIIKNKKMYDKIVSPETIKIIKGD